MPRATPRVGGVGAFDVALADGAGLAVADADEPGAAPARQDAPLMVQSAGCPARPSDVVSKPTETEPPGCIVRVPAVAGHRHLASVDGVGTVPQGGERRAVRQLEVQGPAADRGLPGIGDRVLAAVTGSPARAGLVAGRQRARGVGFRADGSGPSFGSAMTTAAVTAAPQRAARSRAGRDRGPAACVNVNVNGASKAFPVGGLPESHANDGAGRGRGG